MKKTFSILLSAAMVMSLAACGSNSTTQTTAAPSQTTAAAGTDAPAKEEAPGEQAAETVTLKFVEQMPDGHIMTDTLYYFADKVEELSGGSIKVERYSGGQLGDDTAMQEGVQMGTIDVIRTEFTTLVNFGAKKVEVTTLPYVIRDRDHFWKMANSDVGKELLSSIQEDGTQMVGLCIIEEGSRHFFTKDPVNSLGDLAGKKLRVQNTEMWLEIIKSLGASPTPMSFSELYTSLQSGVVDGAEQPLSGFVSQKFYEVCPNMILDGHVYPVEAYVISEKTWNKLTDEQKEILYQAAKETQTFNRESIQAAEDEIMESFDELGVTVVEVPDKSEWINAVQPVYDKFGSEEVLALLKRIQDIE